MADRKRMIVIVAIGAVIIIGLLLFMRARSNKADLARAFNNLARAQSFHTVAELELSLPVRLRNETRPIVGVTTKVEGDVAYENETPVLTGNMYMEARGRGMVLFADGDLRLLPDAVAFNLKNLPALLNPSGSLVEKWTYVNAPVLQTNNREDFRVAMAHMLEGMEYTGRAKIADGGPSLQHFRREVSAEQENILIEVFRQSVSGNRALHIITRLLRTFDVSAFEVWVNPQEKTVAQIRVTFKKPSDAADEFRSKITLQFSEYGKPVTVDRPKGELTVKPEVFAQIFGGGEIEPIQ